jgi:hypothetical protein
VHALSAKELTIIIIVVGQLARAVTVWEFYVLPPSLIVILCAAQYARMEKNSVDPVRVDSSPALAEFMEPEPPILSNEVSTLVDCFQVRVNHPIALM